jgi:hypothetical protein
MEVSEHTGTIQLFNPPVLEVETVSYWDGSTWVTMDEADYTVYGIESKYLSISTTYQRVRIEYSTTPHTNFDIVRLMKELISIWYDHRPDSEELEQRVVNRLANYKVWRVE